MSIPELSSIELIPVESLNDQGDGTYTATVGAHPDLHDGEGHDAQDGDVLSLQEDGSLQTRRAGTAGPFERCTKDGSLLVYCPTGGRTYGIAFTTAKRPNV